MPRKRVFTAKEVTRILQMMNSVPMTEREKEAAAERRVHVRQYRRRMLRKLLKRK